MRPYVKVDEGYARLPDAGLLVSISSTPGPSPGAYKNLPARAGEPTLILSSQLLDPHLCPPRLDLTFWSERAMGQATLSVSRDLSPKNSLCSSSVPGVLIPGPKARTAARK
jgi:hypothetical protein